MAGTKFMLNMSHSYVQVYHLYTIDYTNVDMLLSYYVKNYCRYCDSFSKGNEENPVWEIIDIDIFTRDILETGLLDPARTRSRPPPDPTGRPPPPAYKTQKNRIHWVSRLGSLHSPRPPRSWPPHHHLWLNIYLSFGDFKTVNLEPWSEFCELNHN